MDKLDYLEPVPDYEKIEVASALDELSFWAARFGYSMLDYLKVEPASKILDVGCGTGFPLFELAHRYGPSCQFTGIDPWAAGLVRAAQKLAIYNLPNVQLIEADAAQMPLATNQFDLIVSNLGINNFSNPAQVLTECARVSRTGARLALTTNPIGHFHQFYAAYRQVLTEFGNPEYLARLAANEAHRGNLPVIQTLLQQAGYEIINVKEQEFSMRFLDGSAFFRHFLIRIGFLEDWRAVVDPAVEQEIFLQLEGHLNEIARQNNNELVLSVPLLYIEARLSAKAV